MTNEKYIGNNVYNKRSTKLRTASIGNPPEMWIRREDAHEGIVPKDVFFAAQKVLQDRAAAYTDEDLIDKLRQLLRRTGWLSAKVIACAPDMPACKTYSDRFGSLKRAYEQVGYLQQSNLEYKDINRRIRRMHLEILERNHRINRLSTIQEHLMIRRAIEQGVSKERLAKAFDVNTASITKRVNLLKGICPEAVALLQDKQFPPDLTRVLRNMKPKRQVESLELMIASNGITMTHAESLLKATPPEQRTDSTLPTKPKAPPIEQIAKLEKEMSQVQTQYQDAEQHYGSDLLNLVVAKSFITKLLANESVKHFIESNNREILAHFELVINTISMEEAVQQQQSETVSGVEA